MTTESADALLGRYRPVMQYDSLESYPADWAAVISDRPGNLLKRADGTILAAAGPAGGALPALTLSFLGPQHYANGQPVQADDLIDEVGQDYVAQAREMHGRPGYGDKVHGRVVEQAGVTWLQYWFFMYYDDPGFLDLGAHEGDIEMIQVRLDAAGNPDAASYAQHRSGVQATWAQVEQQGGAPVVYSARGTHASMLRHGTVISDRSFLPDHNDARGRRVQLELVELSPTATPWALWPGHWGGTKPESQVLGQVGVEANSPAAMITHRAWNDPNGFHAACDDADVPPVGSPHVDARPTPPAPRLQVSVDPRGRAHVRYDVTPAAGEPAPTKLVIGLDAHAGTVPPATTAVDIAAPTGELSAPLEGAAIGPLQVHATAHTADGRVSPTATASTPAPGT